MPLPSPGARFRLAAAAVLAAAAAPAGAEVRVQVTDAQVDLTATAAPLAEVLDRLGRQTGLKVVYEGAAPRQLVNVTLTRRTTAEAVLALLEGQGLNFALVYDAAGTKPATLLIAGTAGVPAGAGAAPRPALPAPRRPPFAPPAGLGPDAAEPPFDEGDEEPEEEPLGIDTPPAEVGVPPGEVPVGVPVPPGSPVPAAPGTTSPGPQAPQQQFPVSPFAPRPPAPVVPAAPPPAAPTSPPPVP